LCYREKLQIVSKKLPRPGGALLNTHNNNECEHYSDVKCLNDFGKEDISFNTIYFLGAIKVINLELKSDKISNQGRDIDCESYEK
jgi:hypothetical protein